MKQWIEGAWTELITMAVKLLDKPEAENRPFGSMMKNMEPDEPLVQILIRLYHCLIFDHSFQPASRPRALFFPPKEPDKIFRRVFRDTDFKNWNFERWILCKVIRKRDLLATDADSCSIG